VVLLNQNFMGRNLPSFCMWSSCWVCQAIHARSEGAGRKASGSPLLTSLTFLWEMRCLREKQPRSLTATCARRVYVVMPYMQYKKRKYLKYCWIYWTHWQP